MSWWVYLEDEQERPVRVERHEEGGTYALGGVESAELNVTYNYGARYREVFPEIEGSGILTRMLDGKRAGDTFAMLERGVKELGTDTSGDYWDATPGNAGAALATLRDWASANPDAVWRVS